MNDRSRTLQRLLQFWRWFSLSRFVGWPFRADPAPTGVMSWGRPAPAQPFWLCGNSRHELTQLQRIDGPSGLSVLALDTGGLTLAEAVHDSLTLAEIAMAIDGFSPPDSAGAIAVLPYPVWLALGEEDRYTEQGWCVIAGPANARDLVGLQHTGRVREGWQHLKPDWGDYARALAMHTLLLSLFASVLLLLIDSSLLFTAALLLASAMPTAWMTARISGDRLGGWPRTVLAATTTGLLVTLLALLFAAAPGAILYLAFGGALTAGWLDFVLARGRQISGFPVPATQHTT